MRHSTYAAALSEISARAASAIVARGNLRSDAARAMLQRRLRDRPGTKDGLLADPIYEAARVWKPAEPTMADLSGTLLRPDIVDALASAGEQAIPRDRHPYSHQLSAWQHTATGKSIMVTSGTGSGKTECFMVPMLNDLVTQAETGARHGVRGIVIYPLNALIESQRERLSAWIAPFDGKVSYALYNGETPDNRNTQKPPAPAEIGDRKTLRKSPANLLVTNVTMLEYMLTRSQDRNILAKSEKLLRWIVLDEAHTYVGAQAAEMALLLRRVRQAFGVRAEDVRLVATSATIGEGAETAAALRRFVADLGGVPESQVEVIMGEERQPDLPVIGPDLPFDPSAIDNADPAELWSRLAPHPRVRKARDHMRAGGATLRDLAPILCADGTANDNDATTRRLLDAMAQAQSTPDTPALAPWRLNVFHRAQAGLFACIDPACKARAPELSADGSDWPFGQIHLHQIETCSCGAPTFEITACSECGTPWLLAQMEIGKQRTLRQGKPTAEEDDFHLDVEPGEADDGPTVDADVVIGRPRDDRPSVPVRLSDAVVRDIDTTEPGHVSVSIFAPKDRGCCDAASTKFCQLGRQRFGAPFLLGSAFPLLLETMPPLERSGNVLAMPYGGRRLLSFTDSRQGTARFSAKLQKEAERNLTRAAIWHAVQAAGQGDPDRAAELRDRIGKLESIPGMEGLVAEERAKLAAADGGSGEVTWREMIGLLAGNPELTGFAGEAWRGRPYGGKILAEEPAKLAELFLLSEMFRRPRLQNNAETLGLVRLVFPELERKARAKPVPEPLHEAGHGVEDWIALISLAIDNEFRGQLNVWIEDEIIDFAHWVSPRQATNTMFGPDADDKAVATSGRTRRWPRADKDRNRLVKMIYAMIGGSADSGMDRTRADDVLASLWTSLSTSGILRNAGPGAWQLNLRKSALARQDRAWQCPLTQRILPYSCGGRSPNSIDGPRLAPVVFPRLPNPSVNGLTEAQRAATAEWLQADLTVQNLRARGFWSDLHDRAALFAPFLRAQEHSGQIDRNSLKTYEDQFKAGRINILNCSTTMEMGVDIPDVGTVVNTNVPPAPSNYRQRIGRAGRRGEPWALSFTFCKDKPLDWQVFHAPQRLLAATIAAPAVRLDSPIIVGRHVNALLFGMFLRGAGGADVTMKIGGFFGAPKELDQPWAEDAMADLFLAALDSEWSTGPEVSAAVADLVRGTALHGLNGLARRTHVAFSDLRARWKQEFLTLSQGWAAAKEGDIERAFYANRARKMRNDTLMTELARRGFAPAYGFPVDVVEFNRLRDNTAGRSPSRQLEIAIRDYAPGAEVVIDGLVHRSDGILPAWSNRFDPNGVEDLRSRWSCPDCFAFGVSRHRIETCPECEATPQQTEILRPSGFLSRSKPHTSYEAVRFVAPDRPRIAAGHAAWQALANPALGRMRSNRAGQVLYTASGGTFGYAICITCGLAHPEAGHAGETALPAAIARHFPLMLPSRETARADGICPACDAGSRRIRRNVVLGHEIATDVFELQIDTLHATEQGRDRALCIAAALREALSQRLGIEAEEIGIGAEPSLREDGQKRMSMYLFDRSSGGSGFSPLAADRLPDLIVAAADRLNCRSRCSHGCPDCVLRGDIQYDQDRMDRPGALDTLTAMIPLLSLPPELQVFGPQTQPITQTLAGWLSPRLIDGLADNVVIYLRGAPADWGLPDLAHRLPSFSLAGTKPCVAIDKGAVTTMDMAQRLDLLRLLSRTDASLRYWEAEPDCGGQPLLISMTRGGQTFGIASSDPEAVMAGPSWGRVSQSPLLLGPWAPVALSKPLSAEKVATFREGDTKRSDITTEFDGPLAGFGAKFWSYVRSSRPQAFAGTKSLVSLSYNDRYLRDPVSVLLLGQIMAKAPGRTAATSSNVRVSALKPSDRYLHRNLQDDWQDDRLRREVFRALIPGAQIDIADYKRCPHRRQITMTWDDGHKIEIALDQGVGAWTLHGLRQIPHDATAPAQDQINALRRVSGNVTLRDGPSNPSILWLSWGENYDAEASG